MALSASGCALWSQDDSPLAATDAVARLAAARTDLAVEQKILRQELALARQETATLRAALERSGQGTPEKQDAQLAALRQELEALRADQARFATDHATGDNLTQTADATRVRALEEQLASAGHVQEQLQREVTHLRNQLEERRAENLALAEELRRTRLQRESAEALLAQHATPPGSLRPAGSAAAATPAEPSGSSRAPLDAAGENRAAAATSFDRTPVATIHPPASTSRLQLAKSPPAGAATSDVRALPSADSHIGVAPATPVPASPEASHARPTAAARVHVVRAGDTLEQLSRQYYGAPDRWHLIYEANQAELSSGRPMRPGTELTIPLER